ncbi:PF05872 domain protein, partial [Propionibacterium acidifaciens F0233]
MADQQLPAEQVDGIRDSCAFGEPAIDLGVLGNGGGPVTDARIRIPLRMVARHGLIAGATGTGRTVTLQLLAESLSAAGVPVLAADIEGDLSGIALPGVPGDGLA